MTHNKSAFKAGKGEDGVVAWESGITYSAGIIREKQLIIYKSLVQTSTLFIQSEWTIVGVKSFGAVNEIQISDDTNGFTSDNAFTWSLSANTLTAGSGNTLIGSGDKQNALFLGADNCLSSTGVQDGGIVIGQGNLVIGDISSSMAIGFKNRTSGVYGLSMGFNACSAGRSSFAHGDDKASSTSTPLSERVLASGRHSINLSANDLSQTAGYGTLANWSGIFGGYNHNIAIGNTSAVIIGGNTIDLTGTSYINHVAIPNIAIWTTPNAGATVDAILVWDSISKKVKQIPQHSASNGLSYNTGNGIFTLGGTLTGDTIVDTNNLYGIVFGNNSEATANDSFSQGFCASATGNYSSAFGTYTKSYGTASVAFGCDSISRGLASFATGLGTCAGGTGSFASGVGVATTKPLYAYGASSFNHSENTVLQTLGHGALANQSAILGGQNHNIAVGNERAVILGGNAIKLTGTSYINYVVAANLGIWGTPLAGSTIDEILVWDSTDKRVKKIPQSTNVSYWRTSGNTNILTGVTVRLSTGDTINVGMFDVTGATTDSYLEIEDGNISLTQGDFRNTNDFDQILISNISGSTLQHSIASGVQSILLDGSTMLITDTINSIGLQYAADYSTSGASLGDRWIPDKGYTESRYWKTSGTTVLTSTEVRIQQTNVDANLILEGTPTTANNLTIHNNLSQDGGYVILQGDHIGPQNGVQLWFDLDDEAGYGGGMFIRDLRNTPEGMYYLADYSSGGTVNRGDRWIPDWGSVWRATTSTTLNYPAIANANYVAVDGITNPLDINAQTGATTFDFITQNILDTGRTSTGAANFLRFQNDDSDVFTIDSVGDVYSSRYNVTLDGSDSISSLGAGIIGFGTVGGNRFRMTSLLFQADAGGGPIIHNRASTATIVTLVPNRNASTTGIGGASDTVANIITGTTATVLDSTGFTIYETNGSTVMATFDRTNGNITLATTGMTTIASGLTLSTTPTSGSSTQILIRNTNTGVVEYKDESDLPAASGGSTTWLDLTDTDPTTYASQSGKSVRVNVGETGLEFYTIGAGNNDFLTGATFNTSDGIITLNVKNQSNVTVDIDNRYSLTAHTHGVGADNQIQIGDGAGGFKVDNALYFDGTGTDAIGIGTSTTTATGSSSIAIGDNTKADALWAIAIGTNAGDNTTGAKGVCSISIGVNANSTAGSDIGQNGIAIGANAESLGNLSIAIGASATASGSTTIAIIGNAIEQNTIAIGGSACADTIGSIAIGQGTCAITNNFALAIGRLVCACGLSSIAIGNQTISDCSCSIAIGNRTEAFACNAIAIGSDAGTNGTGTTKNPYSISIGEGANSTAGLPIGSCSVAIGRLAASCGNDSIAIGFSSLSNGTCSISLGYNSETCGINAIAIGEQAGNTTGLFGSRSVSIGTNTNQGTSNIGDDSVAIGSTAVATGSSSIAIGNVSLSTALCSIAIGSDTRGTALCSIAIGRSSCTAGIRAIAIGDATCALKDDTISMGFRATSNAIDTISIGRCAATGCIGAISIGGRAGNNSVSGDGCYAISIGCASNAVSSLSIGCCTISIGFTSNTQGNNSIAIGEATTGSSLGGITMGRCAKVTGNYSVLMGYSTTLQTLTGASTFSYRPNGILGFEIDNGGLTLGTDITQEIKTIKVALTSGQTKTLATTGVTGITAPGSNKYIQIFGASSFLNHNGTTHDNLGTLSLSYASHNGLTSEAIWQSASDHLIATGNSYNEFHHGSGSGNSVSNQNIAINDDIIIGVTGSDSTTNGGAVTVFIQYLIIDIS